MHVFLTVVGCVVGLSLLPLPAPSATGGSASGTLTVNGEAVPLRHAYATTQRGFFDPSAEDVRVLLTDRPVEPLVLRDEPALAGLARRGALRGVAVVVSAKHRPVSGSILDRAFNGAASVTGMHRVELESTDGDRFAGRLYMDAAGEFMDVTFQYEATFEAPLARSGPMQTPAGSRNLEDTPQAKAVRAFMKSVAAGDLEGVLKTVSAEGRKQLEGPDGKETLEMLQAFTPKEAEITAVEVKGNTASVTLLEKDESSSTKTTMKVVLENKEWRVSPG